MEGDVWLKRRGQAGLIRARRLKPRRNTLNSGEKKRKKKKTLLLGATFHYGARAREDGGRKRRKFGQQMETDLVRSRPQRLCGGKAPKMGTERDTISTGISPAAGNPKRDK